MLDVKNIKKDFSFFTANPNLSYLDSAASSQTPDEVLDAMNAYYKDYRANIHRGLYEASIVATRKYEEARERIADFIGARKNEIIFTEGATMAMNMLIYSLEKSIEFEDGDEILTTVMEHHSVMIPMQELAKRQGIVLRHLPILEDRNLDYDRIAEYISDKTKIVAISHASNVLGTINDVAKISQYARDMGATVIVDASKTAGHIPINVLDIDCDFLFFSGHKMCAPTGIGVLYGKEKLLNMLPPAIFGGGAVSEVSLLNTVFSNAPSRFEAGTRNIAGAIGLSAAAEYIDNIGIDLIHNHIMEITRYAIDELSGIKGITLFCNRDVALNAGVVSFVVDGIHPHDVAEIVARGGVAVRAGHHCAQPLLNELGIAATIRASFYLYNTKDDVGGLIVGIRNAQAIFSNK